MNDIDKLIEGLKIFKKYNKSAQVFLNRDLYFGSVLEVLYSGEILEKDEKKLCEYGWRKHELLGWQWGKSFMIFLDGYGY